MPDAAVAQEHHTSEHVLPDEGSAGEPSRPDWVIGLEVQVVDFLSGYTVAGVLESFTTGEVTVAIGELIPEQRTVMVQFDSFFFEGETLFCRPKGSGYEAHITIDDVETNGRRREPRFPIKLAGRMIVPCSDPVPLTVVDMSREGLGIELPISLEAGQPVAMSAGPVFVFAIVRHCRSAGQLYRAGLEIQHVIERPARQEERKEESASGVLRRVLGETRASRRGLLGAFDISRGWLAEQCPRWREQ